VDEESNNNGIHLFEKMTAGMYLGEIVRQILLYLCRHQVLSFVIPLDDTVVDDDEDDEDDDDDGCLLHLPYHFDTSYMYVCEADLDDDLEDTRVILEEMCRTGKTCLSDRIVVKKVTVCG
jgi:hexokinase